MSIHSLSETLSVVGINAQFLLQHELDGEERTKILTEMRDHAVTACEKLHALRDIERDWSDLPVHRRPTRNIGLE